MKPVYPYILISVSAIHTPCGCHPFEGLPTAPRRKSTGARWMTHVCGLTGNGMQAAVPMPCGCHTFFHPAGLRFRLPSICPAGTIKRYTALRATPFVAPSYYNKPTISPRSLRVCGTPAGAERSRACIVCRYRQDMGIYSKTGQISAKFQPENIAHLASGSTIM